MYFDNWAGLVPADSSDNIWIGLHAMDENNTFGWTDGSKFDYTNWGDGEPNNSNGNEPCGEVWLTDLKLLTSGADFQKF